MSKELIISITSQETKAAILENDQLVEIHIERDKDHGIVGAICKGRVTKVLPGMQSAFVDIGLERDAFLYVSDFFEDTDEYDKLVTTAEEQVAKLGQTTGIAGPPGPTGSPEPNASVTNIVKYQDRRGRSRRSRRFRLRGKHFENAPPPAQDSAQTLPSSEESQGEQSPGSALSPLPGESLSKYTTTSQESGAVPREAQENAIKPESQTSFDAALENRELEAAGEIDEEPEDSDQVDNVSSQLEEEAEVLALRSQLASESDSDLPGTQVAQATPSEEVPNLEDTRTPVFEWASEKMVCPADDVSAKPVFSRETEKVTEEPGDSSSASIDSSSTSPGPVAAASNGPEVGAPDPVSSSEVLESPELERELAPTTNAATTVPPSKVQFRNVHGTPKFFKRGIERRRRQGNFTDARYETESAPSQPLIGDLLKEGQEILVQIAKEPLGTKGARITSHIALPGRYLVYLPTVDHIGVSRKIESDEERQRLKRIIQENRRGNFPGGFIVRTAGQGKGEQDFKSDINFLYALWAEIKARADKKKGATIVHRDLNLVQRILRDQLSSDFSNIRVDNEVEYAAIVEFINRFQPALVNRVKLYTRETPIFEEFGIQAEIERALRSKVWLKSGGYIVIDQAEALVAIDVNTGKYVGKSNKLEDTIVKTNIEAAREIARQIRLRDLGGIIVCDFIDMEDRKNRLKVTQTLEESLRTDKSPSKILQFNDFGLVAITRKRVKQSLVRALCEPCSQCGGSGMIKSAQTVCYEIQGEVKKMVGSLENKEITIRVSPEVAKALKGPEISVVREIESTFRKDVVIKTDPLLHPERFDVF